MAHGSSAQGRGDRRVGRVGPHLVDDEFLKARLAVGDVDGLRWSVVRGERGGRAHGAPPRTKVTVEMMRPKEHAPMTCVNMAYTRSESVMAYTSPYPTAIIVAMTQ